MNPEVKLRLVAIWNRVWVISLVSLFAISILDLATSALFIKLGYAQLEGNAIQRSFITNPNPQSFSTWVEAQWAWFLYALFCMLPWLEYRIRGEVRATGSFAVFILFPTYLRLNVGVASNVGTLAAIAFGWGIPVSSLIVSIVGICLTIGWAYMVNRYLSRLIAHASKRKSF